VTTGFLGMNLFSESDASWLAKSLIFILVFVPTIALTFYTIVKSKRLSDFLDLVSDERVPTWHKVKAFFAVWGRNQE
jgi:cell division protein FtsW (lipid II flippase)